MFKFFSKVGKGERGAADLIVTILFIPISVFLLLGMIDISVYLNTKSVAQNIVRDETRQAASWGGWGSRGDGVRLNANTNGISTPNAIKQLFSNQRVKNLSVSCSGPRVATNAGQTITCSASYVYPTVTPGADLFGFSKAVGGTTKVQFSTTSETGYR